MTDFSFLDLAWDYSPECQWYLFGTFSQRRGAALKDQNPPTVGHVDARPSARVSAVRRTVAIRTAGTRAMSD
jgi:hypothetical protein